MACKINAMTGAAKDAKIPAAQEKNVAKSSVRSSK
jgi:hypothetical protein